MMRRISQIMLILVLIAVPLYAQQDQGAITGQVIDATGAIIPNAIVVATGIDTGTTISVQSNSLGIYVINGLKVGNYRVTAEISGFKRAVIELLSVSAQSRVRVDFQLNAGDVNDAVTIALDTPLIEKESSSLAQSISEEQIRELPVAQRNFQQLATQSAGILPALNHNDKAGGFNANGQWATQNNFILDGVDNNSQVLGLQDQKAQVLIPNLDAVKEFRIQTSNYSAEFGRNAGAVMNVTLKSGTNKFHGTVFEYLRNDVFDARSRFQLFDRNRDGKADAEALRQNQFGGVFGGPIIKNKTFFFTSFEGLKSSSTDPVYTRVPTLQERQGIFNLRIKDPAKTGQCNATVATGCFTNNTIPVARWDSVAKNLLSLWPQQNYVDTAGGANNYASESPFKVSRYQFDTRLDHDFSENDRGFVRFSLLDYYSFGEGPLPAPAVSGSTVRVGNNDNRGYSLAMSETHVINRFLINEFRLGYNRLQNNRTGIVTDFINSQYGLIVPQNDLVPGLARIAFTQNYESLGEGTNQPNFKLSDTYQILDNLIMTHGAHTFKGGVDVRFIRTDAISATNTRGVFQFNGRFTNSAFADYLLGLTNQRSAGTVIDASLRERDYMGYVQDDWKITPRLTLNFGVRYELNSPMYEANNKIATLDMTVFPRVVIKKAEGDSWSGRALQQTDKNNILPRIGFAWEPSSGWTVRAAAGVFNGTTGGGLGQNQRSITNWPFNTAVTVRATGNTVAASAGKLSAGIGTSFLGSDTVMPDQLTWNVWDSNFKLPTIYQWNASIQHQLDNSSAVTLAYVGSSSNYLARSYNINGAYIGDPNTEQQRRPNPSLGTVLYRTSGGHSSYNSMQASLDRRLKRGFRLSASYTWSHSIDDSLELFGDEDATVQDIYNMKNDRGNSGFDVRHRFSSNYMVEIPLGKGHRFLSGKWADKFLGGWQWAGTTAIQTGRAFEIEVQNATQRLGVTTTAWRANLVGDWRLDNPTADMWFNTAAFTIPCDTSSSGSLVNCRFGNVGRNSLRGPGLIVFDSSLQKNFKVKERQALQFRWEVFNVFNKPNFGKPSVTLGTENFGKITSTVTDPRQMQFALKYIF